MNSLKKDFHLTRITFLSKNINHKILSFLLLNTLKVLDKDFFNKYSFIYCAGKGGFSLDISSSKEQIEAFTYLINTLVKNYSDRMCFT